jgi:hypothetical protein
MPPAPAPPSPERLAPPALPAAPLEVPLIRVSGYGGGGGGARAGGSSGVPVFVPAQPPGSAAPGGLYSIQKQLHFQ